MTGRRAGEPSSSLDVTTDRLSAEFSGIFGPETVERFTREILSETATVTAFLPHFCDHLTRAGPRPSGQYDR